MIEANSIPASVASETAGAATSADPSVESRPQSIGVWRAPASFTRERADVPTPAQRLGLAYEKKVGRWISQFEPSLCRIEVGPWYFAQEPNTKQRAFQPDFLLHFPEKIVVIETKIRAVSGMWTQLANYLRIVHAVHKLPVAGAIVTKSYETVADAPKGLVFSHDETVFTTWLSNAFFAFALQWGGRI